MKETIESTKEAQKQFRIPFPEKFNMSANDMLKYENIIEDFGSLLDTMASTLNDDEYELFRTEFMSKLKEI